MRARKAGRPETVGQAREWDRNLRAYVALGLCHGCAAQAAWGHQVGFGLSEPPCPVCRPVVAGFDVARAGGWRSASPAERMSVSGVGGPRVPRTSDVDTHGAARGRFGGVAS